MSALTILYAAVLSFLVSQVIKIGLQLRKKSWNYRMLFLDGHFPSSHSAIMSAMTSGVFYLEGLSALFVVCLILLLVIVRDAVGVRQQVGRLTKEVRIERPSIAPYQGHTLDQVLGGLCIGILVSFVLFRFI